jgi:hypothetical protein
MWLCILELRVCCRLVCSQLTCNHATNAFVFVRIVSCVSLRINHNTCSALVADAEQANMREHVCSASYSTSVPKRAHIVNVHP